MAHLPKLIDNKCGTCGHQEMVLAEDMTRYTHCSLVDGKWVRDGSEDTQMSVMDDAVRLICEECGEVHLAPDELN